MQAGHIKQVNLLPINSYSSYAPIVEQGISSSYHNYGTSPYFVQSSVINNTSPQTIYGSLARSVPLTMQTIHPKINDKASSKEDYILFPRKQKILEPSNLTNQMITLPPQQTQYQYLPHQYYQQLENSFQNLQTSNSVQYRNLNGSLHSIQYNSPSIIQAQNFEGSKFAYSISKVSERAPTENSTVEERRKIFSPSKSISAQQIQNEILSKHSDKRKRKVSGSTISNNSAKQFPGYQNDWHKQMRNPLDSIISDENFIHQSNGSQLVFSKFENSNSNIHYNLQKSQQNQQTLQNTQIHKIISPERKKIFSVPVDYSKNRPPERLPLLPIDLNEGVKRRPIFKKSQEENAFQRDKPLINGSQSRLTNSAPIWQKSQDDSDASYQSLNQKDAFVADNSTTRDFSDEGLSRQKNSALMYLEEERIKRNQEKGLKGKKKFILFGIGAVFLLILLALLYFFVFSA